MARQEPARLVYLTGGTLNGMVFASHSEEVAPLDEAEAYNVRS
ncbi:MAG: hypothetical protein SV429_11755 [Pseudomonadota bacterium]|nr:hypothetical protein [Pseudomonadota bacterium]